MSELIYNKIQITEKSYLLITVLPSDMVIDFDSLWKEKPTTKPTLMMYGKELETPRYFQSYCVPYYFTGKLNKAEPLPNSFKFLKDFADNSEHGKFDQVLVNWYDNGLNYIGAHSDDTTQLEKDSPIFSISLGSTRTFRIRNKIDKKILHDIPLTDRSIVIMCGKFQTELTHEVVKINGKKGENVGKRINITFRKYK
jgi:alkylated DNA repair dioxygenase AlkB